MGDFIAFKDYDIRTHKIINFGKPAVELNYYLKHKYFVDTQKTEDEIRIFLSHYIKDLAEEREEINDKIKRVHTGSFDVADVASLLASYRADLETLKTHTEYWQEMAKNLSDMEWVVSNYTHGFHYYELGYKYYDAVLEEFVSTNSHMVKNQFNKNGELTQERHNLIFVDEKAIGHPVPNQHKMVEKLLATFPQQITVGIRTYYFKGKHQD